MVINEKPLRIMGSAMSGVNLENCEHPCLRNPCDHGKLDWNLLQKIDMYVNLIPINLHRRGLRTPA